MKKLSCALLSACCWAASLSGHAQGAVSPAVTPAAAAPATAPATTPAQPVVTDPDYIIGPGDVLQVFVWQNPELSVSVPVRPDGKISTPLVEDMIASGKTPSLLARDMEKVLAEFVRTPQVNVIVTQAVSSNSAVKVVGQVRSPQVVPYRKGLRVLDVVLASGGLTEFAAPNRAKIVRTDGTRQTEVKIKLGKLINGGDLDQNVELMPGDVLIIPQSMF
jgi:polysaccharide export outer membrane protein